MTIISKMINTAMTGMIAVGLSMNATSALAKAPEMEKCYGIVKAGKNDCGTPGDNACAGQVKQNNDPEGWILLPKGTCNKIVGGSLTAKGGAETKGS